MGIIRKTVVVGASVLVLAGCAASTKTTTVGSAPPVSVATQSSAAKSSAPNASVAAYVTALGHSEDPDVMREGLANAAPKSPAFVYLSHQANVSESALDAGQPYSAGVQDSGHGERRAGSFNRLTCMFEAM
jgi:hypothetical protein